MPQGGNLGADVPQALHVGFQLALAPAEIAGLTVTGAIHSAADVLTCFQNCNVLTGHMDIIHQIDGGGQTGNTTADDVGVAGFDSFRCVCVVLQIIDFHNSCSFS